MLTLEELQVRENELRAEIKSLDSQLHRVLSRITRLKEAEAKEYLAKGTPNWSWVLDIANDTDARHRYADKAIHNLGGFVSGYWADTMQAAVKLQLYLLEPESEAKALNLIRTLAPHYKPQKDGLIWFDVFDHDMCETRNILLKVSPDLKAAKLVDNYRRYNPEPVHEGTIEECMSQLRLKYWYCETSR